MNLDMPLRIFLPVYLAVFLLITYTLNVSAFIRRHGIDPRVTGPSDPVLYLCQRYRDAIVIGIMAIVGVHAVSPTLYAYLVPIAYLEIPVLRIAGVVLMLATLVLVRLGQHQLGSAWRIGIDRSGRPSELVVTGLFSRTRNPIALGLLLQAIGLFLALPNAATFAIAMLTALILQIRVRVEEEHLLQTHDAAYEAYRQRTPRWF